MKLLHAIVFFAPVLALAAEPFDGTWRMNLQSANFGTKPDKYEIANGVYKCATCDPPFSVKADGKDQPRSGSPYYDTTAVRIIDGKTVEIVNKKDGKVVSSSKITVSADGKSATGMYTRNIEQKEQPMTGTMKFTRVAQGPAGSHAFSGSWLPEKAETTNAMTFSCKSTGDGLSVTNAMGESYTGKFDGNDYPYKGNPGITSVSMKRIDANTIEETDKKDGKPILTQRMTVSPDGRTMTLVTHDLRRNDTSKIIAEKQ